MDILQLDTSTATPEELVLTVEAYLLAATTEFLRRVNTTLRTENVLRLTQLISMAALLPPMSPAVSDALADVPSGAQEAIARIQNGHATIDATIQRKATIDLYEAFELFLGDALTVLFYAFPRFLTAEPENVVLPATHFDDLFRSGSLVEARLAIARRKVAQLLFSENIHDLLRKTEKRFGVALSIDDHARSALLEFSATRNLLVHNAGVVNDIHVRLLRRYALTPRATLGNEVAIDDQYIESVSRLCGDATKSISRDLAAQLTQLQQHHSAMA